MPPIASPSDAPIIEASARGVSTTRSAPYLSCRPRVTLKTPPSRPTSMPSTITLASRAISSKRAVRIASRIEDSESALTAGEVGAASEALEATLSTGPSGYHQQLTLDL